MKQKLLRMILEACLFRGEKFTVDLNYILEKRRLFTAKIIAEERITPIQNLTFWGIPFDAEL